MSGIGAGNRGPQGVTCRRSTRHAMRRLAPLLLITGLYCTVLTLRAAGGPFSTATEAVRPHFVSASHGASRTVPVAAPDYNAVIEEYCLECHDEKPKKNTLVLASFDVAKADQHPEIAEIEMNPLLVLPQGAVGLDARIVLRDRDGGTDQV